MSTVAFVFLAALNVTPLEAPVPDGTLTPHLASSGDALYLSWLERLEEGHALRFVAFDGSAFGEPRTIHTSNRFFANWADFASIAPLGDGRLAAHWLEKAGEGSYEYDVWISLSDDGGETWGTPQRPHRDGTLSEHGFVSLVPRGERGFAAVWLDGRKFEEGAADNEMSLMFTSFDGERLDDEVLRDGRVCECCQTTMVPTGEGLFVAYRDRSPEEIRDIAFVRSVAGEWTEPERLHPDDWHLQGCPVNGPQAVADEESLAVAWFAASGRDPRVQVVFSEDSGRSFGTPVRVDDGKPAGRVDIERVGEATYVSWIERAEGREGEVRVRRVSPSGELGESLTVARTASGRASGFARMAAFRGALYVSWTESYERKGASRVRLARLRPDAPLLDEPAVAFEAPTLGGKTLTLSELSGKVVLLNFWGIWCKSCRQEIPHLVEMDRAWRERGLVVLGADYGDDPRDLPAFVEELGMTYPVLVDDGLADDYEILVYPTSVVIDRAGRVRYRVEGYREESFEALKNVVERLLEAS